MINDIKAILKRKPFIYRFMTYIYWWPRLYGKTFARMMLGRYLVQKPRKFKYPTTLQLPITYKCNCDCIMCGMSENQSLENFTSEELRRIIKDDLFKSIISVGVNGGEPFLVSNLEEYIAVLIQSLPKLKNIFIISNGSFTKRTLKSLKKIKEMCKQNDITVSVSISIDGIDATHDLIRGLQGVFNKASETCKIINEDKEKYCDNFKVICTITKKNIVNINEVNLWAETNDLEISYNVATIHERLNNYSRLENFSVFSDKHTQMLTTEFFYSKFFETKSQIYFQLYYYCANKKRISTCSFKDDGVTITPEGDISYCATYSKIIGNALEDNSLRIYKENLGYREELCRDFCDNCSHYSGPLTLQGQMLYNKEIMKLIGNPISFTC